MTRPRTASRAKLVVIGDGMVGKTCLLVSFSRGQFVEGYIPTVFETYVADIEVDGKPVELALWDTAGQEDYDRLRPISYPDTDVLLLAYAVDNRSSFENIQDKWIPELRHFCPKVPILLVATKKDTRTTSMYLDSGGVAVAGKCDPQFVSHDEGAALAKQIGADKFLETSAKTMENIHGAFEAAARTAVFRKKNRLIQHTCRYL